MFFCPINVVLLHIFWFPPTVPGLSRSVGDSKLSLGACHGLVLPRVCFQPSPDNIMLVISHVKVQTPQPLQRCSLGEDKLLQVKHPTVNRSQKLMHHYCGDNNRIEASTLTTSLPPWAAAQTLSGQKMGAAPFMKN